MFKLISIIKWESSNKVIALVYADSASDLDFNLNNLILSKGSIAYTSNGKVYILGDEWAEMGA